MTMKPTSVHLGDEDREAIAKIKQMYGSSLSDAAVIRLALQIASKQKPQSRRTKPVDKK